MESNVYFRLLWVLECFTSNRNGACSTGRYAVKEANVTAKQDKLFQQEYGKRRKHYSIFQEYGVYGTDMSGRGRYPMTEEERRCGGGGCASAISRARTGQVPRVSHIQTVTCTQQSWRPSRGNLYSVHRSHIQCRCSRLYMG